MTESNLKKACSLMGFARKAGKLAAGFDIVRDRLPKCKGGLVILAEDSSPSVQKEIRFLSDKYHIDLIALGNKALLGEACGLSPRSVLFKTEEHIAAAIAALEQE